MTDSIARADAQTLLRGLDVLESVARGRQSTVEICESTGLAPETVRRLTRTLIWRGYLGQRQRGLALGRAVVRLAGEAERHNELIAVARPILAELAERTEEAVHLAVEQGGEVAYVHVVNGRRRLSLRSLVGEMRPMTRTSLGRALMLDWEDHALHRVYERENDGGGFEEWLSALRLSQRSQTTYDDAEFEPLVHCIGAPVRSARGTIIAAVSVSTAGGRPSTEWRGRVETLVRTAARAISAGLGATVGDA
jgi:DNA-binding IclR family transcriptional regulator